MYGVLTGAHKRGYRLLIQSQHVMGPTNVMTEFPQSMDFTPVVICHCGDYECCFLISGNLINEKHLSQIKGT